MSGALWPRVLDMNEDESRKALRSLELSTYSSLVTTFRAQGDLTPQKRTLLSQLQTLLGVTTERHRAEVRRCVNDEKLSTVAYHMVGENHDNEWMVEGRRVVPLVPRQPAKTAYTVNADQLASQQAEKNLMLPHPALTGNRENFTLPGTLFSPPPPPHLPVLHQQDTLLTSPGVGPPPSFGVGSSTPAPVTKYSRAQSPNTNVVVLPSGTSIHIKGGLNLDEDEDITGAKRRRIASTESVATTSKPIVSRGGQSSTPMKITLSKPASSSAQKVILVSSTGQSISSTATIKSANSTVPIVKSVTPITSHTRTSVVYPANSTSQSDHITTGPSIHTAQGLTVQRPRAKATLTATPRLTGGITKPTTITVSRPGMVIPVGASGITTARTVAGKPGIHIKQEGAMKIITSSGSKLLPKASMGGAAPIVVVTSAGAGAGGGTTVTSGPQANSQSPTTIPRNTVITNSSGTGAVAISSGKVISINTGKVMSTGPNIVPGQPSGRHTSGGVPVRSVGQSRVIGTSLNQRLGAQTNTVSSMGSVTSQTITTTTGKSGNVVIVQQPGTSGRQPATIVKSSGTGMELVSFIQKQAADGSTKPIKQANLTTSIRTLAGSASPITMNIKSSDYNKPSILAGLIHSAENRAAANTSSNGGGLVGENSTSQVVVTSLSSSQRAVSSAAASPAWLSSSPSSGYSSSSLVTSSIGSLSTGNTTVPTIISTHSGHTTAPAESPTGPPKMDIFSSALAEAQINLDPYEFIDEDEPVVSSTATTPTSWTDSMPIWSTSGDNSTYNVSQGEAILSGEMPFMNQPVEPEPDRPEGGSVLDAALDKASSLLAQANSMLAQSSRRTPTPTLPSLTPTPPPSSSPQHISGAQAILANTASGQVILPKGKEPIRILPALPISSAGTGSGCYTIAPKQPISSQKTWALHNSQHNLNAKPVDIQPRVLRIERTNSLGTKASASSGFTVTSSVASATGDVSPSPLIDTKILILPPGIGQPPTPVKDNKAIMTSLPAAKPISHKSTEPSATVGRGEIKSEAASAEIKPHASSQDSKAEGRIEATSTINKQSQHAAHTVVMTVQDVLPTSSTDATYSKSSKSTPVSTAEDMTTPHARTLNSVTDSLTTAIESSNTTLTQSQHFQPSLTECVLNDGVEAHDKLQSEANPEQDIESAVVDSVFHELVDNKSSDSESFQELMSDLIPLERTSPELSAPQAKASVENIIDSLPQEAAVISLPEQLVNDNDSTQLDAKQPEVGLHNEDDASAVKQELNSQANHSMQQNSEVALGEIEASAKCDVTLSGNLGLQPSPQADYAVAPVKDNASIESIPNEQTSITAVVSEHSKPKTQTEPLTSETVTHEANSTDTLAIQHDMSLEKTISANNIKPPNTSVSSTELTKNTPETRNKTQVLKSDISDTKLVIDSKTLITTERLSTPGVSLPNANPASIEPIKAETAQPVLTTDKILDTTLIDRKVPRNTSNDKLSELSQRQNKSETGNLTSNVGLIKSKSSEMSQKEIREKAAKSAISSSSDSQSYDLDEQSSPPLIARKFDRVYRPRNGRNSTTSADNKPIPHTNTVSVDLSSKLESTPLANGVGSPSNNSDTTETNNLAKSSHNITKDTTKPSETDQNIYSETSNATDAATAETTPTRAGGDMRTPLLVLHKTPVKDTSRLVNGVGADPGHDDVSVRRIGSVRSSLDDGSSDAQGDDNSYEWLGDSGHSLGSSNGQRNADNDKNLSGGEDDSGDDDENSNDQTVMSSTGDSLSNSQNIRSVAKGRKRRRKSDQGLNWAKAAMGLLRRVMMFRGNNRNKGEHGAAAWFLKPVSDEEAPGYSDVITTPMDFGTVERKLKAHTYSGLEEFRRDVLLVYTNCCTYNPPEHNVRRDCEQVFVFFNQEYEKLINKMHQAAEAKKAKLEALSPPITSS